MRDRSLSRNCRVVLSSAVASCRRLRSSAFSLVWVVLLRRRSSLKFASARSIAERSCASTALYSARSFAFASRSRMTCVSSCSRIFAASARSAARTELSASYVIRCLSSAELAYWCTVMALSRTLPATRALSASLRRAVLRAPAIPDDAGVGTGTGLAATASVFAAVACARSLACARCSSSRSDAICFSWACASSLIRASYALVSSATR